MKNQLVRVAILVVALGAVATAQSLSEQLQKGIYTQETLGDLDAAVRIFRQVVSTAPPDSDIRVQAQLRLRAAEMLRADRERHRRASEKYATFDGRTYRHTLTGLTFDVPPGWRVEGTGPSSDNGEMVTLFSATRGARISVWMIPETNNAGSIEEKLNRYMGYVLDGHLTSHYPQYEGRPVRIRLDCVHAPAGEAVAFLNAAQHSVRQYGLEFRVKIIPQR